MVTKLAKTQESVGVRFVHHEDFAATSARATGTLAAAPGYWYAHKLRPRQQSLARQTTALALLDSIRHAGWSDGSSAQCWKRLLRSEFRFASPPDANAYTFAGDSLTVADGGRFLFKGTSATAPITINNLILDGGYLRNAQGNAWLLAGSIHLTANGGIVWPSSGAGGTNIASNVDGIGPLAIGGADSGDQSGQVNTLSGTNTYTGPTLLLGGTVTLTGPGALPSGRY